MPALAFDVGHERLGGESAAEDGSEFVLTDGKHRSLHFRFGEKYSIFGEVTMPIDEFPASRRGGIGKEGGLAHSLDIRIDIEGLVVGQQRKQAPGQIRDEVSPEQVSEDPCDNAQHGPPAPCKHLQAVQRHRLSIGTGGANPDSPW